MTARLTRLLLMPSLVVAMIAGVDKAQPPRAAATAPVLRAFATTADPRMRVYVPAGRVRIVAWNRDSVHVTGTIGAQSSMFGGGSREYVKLGVEPQRTGDTRLADADLVVMVPRRAHVWVKVIDGAIDAEGSMGELELYAVGGSIGVQRATGVVSVESIDAAVTLAGIDGDLRVRGGKAPVSLRDVTGSASVATVSGTVTIAGAIPECRVETIGGEIRLATAGLRGATVELQTHSGAIGITVSGSALPLLDLTSRTGGVTRPATPGSASAGRIVARSFKGAITVVTAK